jgi:hypothetical protein
VRWRFTEKNASLLLCESPSHLCDSVVKTTVKSDNLRL